jgi:hypothetical protein
LKLTNCAPISGLAEIGYGATRRLRPTDVPAVRRRQAANVLLVDVHCYSSALPAQAAVVAREISRTLQTIVVNNEPS